MVKILKLLGDIKELAKGNYLALSFWSAVIGILITVFGLDIDNATKAEVSGWLATAAAVVVAGYGIFKKLTTKKQ